MTTQQVMEDIDESLEGNDLCTVHKLSLLLGADRRTIGKRLEGIEPDEIRGTRKYYRLDKVREVLESKAANSKERQKLEIQKLSAQIKNIEIKNNELLKKLVPQEEIARVWLAHIQKAKGTLVGIEDLAPVLAGLNVNQIKSKLHECIIDIITELNESPIEDGSVTEDN